MSSDEPGVVPVGPRADLLETAAALVSRASEADRSPALNEAGALALAHPQDDGVRHLVALAPTSADEVLGYAQLAADGTGQVVVDPSSRRRGVGTRLVQALLEHAADAGSRLQVWAFGDTAAAQALAARTGLVAERALLIMRRPLADLPPPEVPDGVRIAPFREGRDEQPWLAVNARAFAHHPEQGSIDTADLAARMGESWFDPEGFLLARAADDADGPVLGFHWTKQHDGGVGEVYVLGVDPDAQGRGLAKALLRAGLARLRDQGDTEVQLYVEADQPGPVGLYRSHGFAEASRDVLYVGRDPRAETFTSAE